MKNFKILTSLILCGILSLSISATAMKKTNKHKKTGVNKAKISTNINISEIKKYQPNDKSLSFYDDTLKKFTIDQKANNYSFNTTKNLFQPNDKSLSFYNNTLKKSTIDQKANNYNFNTTKNLFQPNNKSLSFFDDTLKKFTIDQEANNYGFNTTKNFFQPNDKSLSFFDDTLKKSTINQEANNYNFTANKDSFQPNNISSNYYDDTLKKSTIDQKANNYNSTANKESFQPNNKSSNYYDDTLKKSNIDQKANNYNSTANKESSTYENLNKIENLLKIQINNMKNNFIHYKNSIYNDTLEEIEIRKIIFTKNCRRIKKLIKSFVNFKNRYLSKINEEKFTESINKKIKDIESIIEGYLLSIPQNERIIYYSFLYRYNQISKEELDQNVISYFNSIDAIKNNFKYPKGINTIENNLKEIQQDINLIKNKNIFSQLSNSDVENFKQGEDDLYSTIDKYIKKIDKKKSINTTDSKINEIENFTKNMVNLSDKSYAAFLTSLKNIENVKNRENFHMLSKQLIDFYDENEKLFVCLNKHDFKNTIKKLKKLKEKVLIQQSKIREATINSSLKESINEFFTCLKQIEKNIKNNEKEIVPKNIINKFENLWNEIRNKCYYFETYSAFIDRNQKNLNKLDKEKKIVENYTLLLKSIGEKPFVNSLIEEIEDKLNKNVDNCSDNEQNEDHEKRMFDSLLFKTQINSYKTKLSIMYKEFENNLEYLSTANNLEDKDIIKNCETWTHDIDKFSKTCYKLLNTIEEKINARNNVKVYGKKSLKKRIVSFKNYIKEVNKLVKEKVYNIIKDKKDIIMIEKVNNFNLNNKNKNNINNKKLKKINNDKFNIKKENNINNIKSKKKYISKIDQKKNNKKNIKIKENKKDQNDSININEILNLSDKENNLNNKEHISEKKDIKKLNDYSVDNSLKEDIKNLNLENHINEDKDKIILSQKKEDEKVNNKEENEEVEEEEEKDDEKQTNNNVNNNKKIEEEEEE